MNDPDYDDIDCLLDTDPIALGERCRDAEAEVAGLRRDVDHWRANHDDQVEAKRCIKALYDDLRRCCVEMFGGVPSTHNEAAVIAKVKLQNRAEASS